jgi:hypothetical protein
MWVVLLIVWLAVVGVLLCACRLAAAADGNIPPSLAEPAPEPVPGPGAAIA